MLGVELEWRRYGRYAMAEGNRAFEISRSDSDLTDVTISEANPGLVEFEGAYK